MNMCTLKQRGKGYVMSATLVIVNAGGLQSGKEIDSFVTDGAVLCREADNEYKKCLNITLALDLEFQGFIISAGLNNIIYICFRSMFFVRGLYGF